MNTVASVTNSYKKVTKWLQFGNKRLQFGYKTAKKLQNNDKNREKVTIW